MFNTNINLSIAAALSFTAYLIVGTQIGLPDIGDYKEWHEFATALFLASVGAHLVEEAPRTERWLVRLSFFVTVITCAVLVWSCLYESHTSPFIGTLVGAATLLQVLAASRCITTSRRKPK